MRGRWCGRRDFFVRDTGLKGFGLKVTLSGSKVYLIRCRLGGRGSTTKRYTVVKHGPFTPDTARDRAEKLLAKVSNGIDPAAEEKGLVQGDASAGSAKVVGIRMCIVVPRPMPLSAKIVPPQPVMIPCTTGSPSPVP